MISDRMTSFTVFVMICLVMYNTSVICSNNSTKLPNKIRISKIEYVTFEKKGIDQEIYNFDEFIVRFKPYSKIPCYVIQYILIRQNTIYYNSRSKV